MEFSLNHGAILNAVQIMKAEMSSDMEAEIRVLFLNARKVMYIR